jgi:hypothetical protein
MPRTSDSPPPRSIDGPAKARFLAALGAGATREDAAAAAGFSITGFYGARSRDPAFAAAWKAALEAAPAGDRRALAYAERDARLREGEVRIAPANRRMAQRRRRLVRFDSARRDLFLACFARDCDLKAAAAAAGVHPGTITYHRRTDPDFDRACLEALDQGYQSLEAEAVRQGLAAQQRHRAAIEAAAAGQAPAPCPHCGAVPAAESDADFDRILRLLALRDRKPRRPDSRFTPGGRRQRWTFDQAIALLKKKMETMDARPREP